MIAAVKAGNNGGEKVSVWWLMASYGVVTIGELFLSPMGLSLVSKLSPVRITSLMMGGWFLSTSIGNKLSGILASKWDEYDDKASYFWLNFFLLFGAAVLLFVLLKWLNKVMKEKGVN
jgi:POT family proton-dependent oligopeptide transporter